MNARYRSHAYAGQSSSFARKQRQRWVLGWSVGLMGIAAWILILSRLTFWSVFAIDTVNVYSPSRDLMPGMQQAAFRTIEGAYLGLFSKSNTLIYPKRAVQAAVTASSPRIGSVSVKRDGRHGLNISISEKPAAAVVCPDLPSFDDNGTLIKEAGCYFADDSGFLFEAVPPSVAGDYNRYYAPNLPDSGLLIGTQATSTARFKVLQAMMDVLKTAGIMPEALLLKDGGAYELYAANPVIASAPPATATSSTVVIYLSDTPSIATELDNLVLFWKTMVDKAELAKTRLEWSDIKLQYPPNIFSTEVK